MSDINSIEAEEAALGGLITAPDQYFLVCDNLKPECFYYLRHQLIMQAVVTVMERDGTMDTLTLMQELKVMNKLDEIGGILYLNAVVNKTPTSVNTKLYAGLVWKAYIRRQLLMVADDIRKVAYNENSNLNDVVVEVEDRVFAVTQQAVERTEVSLKDALGEVYSLIEARVQGEENNYLPTGFKGLDAVIGGLERGCLHIIGGRPGMGKSSLCAGIGLNAARLGVRSYYISTEMQVNRLALRMAAMESGVNVSRLKQGHIEGDEWERCIQAMSRISEIPLHLDYVPAANPSQVKARIARQQRERGLDLLIIDGLWQMTAPGKFDDNRVMQLTHISQQLVDMAKAYNVPLLLAHQLSRKPEDRSDHRPIMSDLEYSGSLEQNADVIMLLYRDEVYNEPSEFPNQADIIIAKNRDGTTGTVTMYFDKATTRFMDGVAHKIDLGSKPMPVLKHNGRDTTWQ